MKRRVWIVLVGVLSLVAPATAMAQDKPGVVEEDLGDGFRAVSVNGGPPAIIDDRTGLIMKLIYGRPAIVDQEAGVILYPGKNGGPPIVKYYKKKGADGGKGKKLSKKMLARMQSYLKRVQKHRKAMDKTWAKKKGKASKKKNRKPYDPVAACLKLLGVSGEEAKVLHPLLAAVVKKQDEIRRSTVSLRRARYKKAKARTGDLPPAIQAFLQSVRTHVQQGKALDPTQLKKGLVAFRAARKKQSAELESLREKLREVLTEVQEAKLAAVGVLD